MVSTQARSLEDEEGYMVAHGNHAHYFYKKDLSPQEIAAAEATLAGKKEERSRGSPDEMTLPAILAMPQMRKKIQYINRDL